MPDFFTSLVGSKPKVPDLPSLNLSAEQQKALAANLAAIPQAEQVATKVDLFNQQQIDKMLENVIPNYKAITSTASTNIGQMLAGEIPTDVSQQIQRSDAARALAGGFAGTQAGGALTARDLGLTSLDLTQRGLASAESWMRTASSIYEPGMFNVTSMFISPAQQAQFDVEERNTQFQRQWMQNQIAAMPAPWAEDLKQFVYRAMAAYSGTSVSPNPYSTPGSFGGGIGGGGGGFGFGGGLSPSDMAAQDASAYGGAMAASEAAYSPVGADAGVGGGGALAAEGAPIF